MRPGLLEIGVIIVVILLIAVVARIVRGGQGAAGKNKKSSVEVSGRQVGERAGRVRRRFKPVGVVFILIGIVLLLAGISLFKWVFWSYLWSFIVMAIGLVLVFMPGKR